MAAVTVRLRALTGPAMAVVADVDRWLNAEVSGVYKAQPLAQDWARVAKVTEEAGEAVAALIAMTGQNPRKGISGTRDELLAELADTALTAVLAIQHFTKDATVTDRVLAASLAKIAARAGIRAGS